MIVRLSFSDTSRLDVIVVFIKILKHNFKESNVGRERISMKDEMSNNDPILVNCLLF